MGSDPDSNAERPLPRPFRFYFGQGQISARTPLA